MEKPISPEKNFTSHQEELNYLREQVSLKEKELVSTGAPYEKEKIISEKISEYTKNSPIVFEGEDSVLEERAGKITLDLAPEAHDKKIEEFFGIIKEKGIKKALYAIKKINNPHLEDDFHRFLVQYVKKGYLMELKEKSPLFKTLSATLYEIALPEPNKEDREKNLKELVSLMEQFYSGMLSVSDEKKFDRHFTIELAIANHSDEFIFYSAVPNEKRGLFEKHLLSVFPTAKLSLKPDDYNIFNESGASVGSYIVYEKNPIFPIKTYEKFDSDPLNVILNSFSKIDKDGEGAAIQIIFKPRGDFYVKKYKGAIDKIAKGIPLKMAIDIPMTLWQGVTKTVKDFFTDSPKKKDKENEIKKPAIDETAVENIKNKISSSIVDCNIRIIASAGDEKEASRILSDVESSFNQFENTGYNKFIFKRQKHGGLPRLFKDFSFRAFSKKYALPINLKELTSFMHFREIAKVSSPQLRHAKAGTAPAPLSMVAEGTFLGINKNRNIDTKVYMSKEDRLRHFYTIGQTGTGKSTLLKNMIEQDIAQGEGVCVIDPHGMDVVGILSMIPKNRYEDVIYFDPSYTERPMALNMLEYDARYPEQKTFVVNEMLSIFNKLFDMKVAGGPMFEQYFRNAVLLAIDDPTAGATLLDVSKVLSNKTFRDEKISKCSNPIVVQFWKEVAEKAGGEASLANIVPYITSKFDVFLSNDIMRPVIAQPKSSFNFREVMDSKKILLVNLAKGRLGDINSNLIGLILVGKILMSALSRADSIGKDLPVFYLYIDEFQNVTTDSIATILSEARKYKLSLNVAHQFIAQLDEKIKDSVFGNVGSIASFRVGAEDAEYLKKQFEPVFTEQDLVNLDNRNAYVKMLVNGKPERAFNIETVAPKNGDPSVTEALKEMSYSKYGKARAEVEAEIMGKYKKSLSQNLDSSLENISEIESLLSAVY